MTPEQHTAYMQLMSRLEEASPEAIGAAIGIRIRTGDRGRSSLSGRLHRTDTPIQYADTEIAELVLDETRPKIEIALVGGDGAPCWGPRQVTVARGGGTMGGEIIDPRDEPMLKTIAARNDAHARASVQINQDRIMGRLATDAQGRINDLTDQLIESKAEASEARADLRIAELTDGRTTLGDALVTLGPDLINLFGRQTTPDQLRELSETHPELIPTIARVLGDSEPGKIAIIDTAAAIVAKQPELGARILTAIALNEGEGEE